MATKSSISLWVEEALKKFRPIEVVEKLRSKGWGEDDILKMLQAYGISEMPRAERNPVYFPEIKTHNGSNKITVLDKEYRVAFESSSPRVVLIEDFITLVECAELINNARERIARSTVMRLSDSGSDVSSARTSEGMFYTKEEFETLSNIEKRLEALTNWPMENQEAMQILRYGVGAEYVAHNDYFDERAPGSLDALGRGGNRVATVIIYLNDVIAGGGTKFPESTIEVKPKACSALFFSYPTCDSRSKTLHAGMPVIEGEKWIAVKWIRESIFS